MTAKDQYYKLEEIEEEGNQSKSSDDSSESDNLFSSQRQVKTVRAQKKKTLYAEKLMATYNSYLHFLGGQQLSDKEQDDLKMFLGNLTQTRLNQLSDKYQYLTEYDYHMGDVVIAFPNPDSPKSEDLGTMTQLEAIQLCLNCFASNKYATEFEVMDNLILIKAIEQNLYHLQSDDEFLLKQYEEEDRMREEQEQILSDESSHRKNVQEQSNRLDTEEKNEGKKNVKRERFQNLKRFGGVQKLFSDEIEKLELKLLKIYNLDRKTRQTAIKEAFNLDNYKLDRFIRIKLSGGKFLEYNEKDKCWVRTENQTKDLSTLIRLAVILQMSKLGFLMRQFISKDGSTIFLVLYQADSNLKNLANKYEITKQLNFQFQDIFSYEPVDDNLRPLRLNNRLWKSNNDYKGELTKMFIYLKPKIVELLEKINFKQVSREINQSMINQQIFSQGDEEVIDDYAPSDEVWKAYYAYLMYLEEKITHLRSQSVIQDEFAQFFNKNTKSKKPYEIYMEKNPDKLQFQDQINSQDIQILEQIQKESEIEQQIDLNGRNIQLIEVFHGIFQIIQEHRKQQKYYDQIKGICNINSNKFISSKDVKVLKKEQLAKSYLDLFQDALYITNLGSIKQLKTIWDLAEIAPFEPFITYKITSDKLAKSQQCKLNAIWKQYCVTETGKISLFSNMERIKINNLALDEKINFTILISDKFVSAKYCLHDNYEIQGKSKRKFFVPIFKSDYNIEILKNKSLFLYFYKEMAERNYLGVIGQNKYQNQEYQFAERKLENLSFQWRFQWNHPWFVPTKQIREYYGEKLAIYFHFVGYNASMLFPIGILGLTISIIQFIFSDTKSSLYVYLYIIFGFIQIQWSNLIHDMWQTKEKVFAMQFGQFNQSGEDTTQQRSQFYGYYSRSIETDNLNVLFFSDLQRVMKKIVSFAFLFLMVILYVGIIVSIFIISDALQDVDTFTEPGYSTALFEVTVPALINLILVLLLDTVFDRLAIALTDYENHKTIKMYEANFIYKKFFLCFFALCVPILEIQFLHTKFGLHCAHSDCLKHSCYHFATMFILQFLINVFLKTRIFVFNFLKDLYLKIKNPKRSDTKYTHLNLNVNSHQSKSQNTHTNKASGSNKISLKPSIDPLKSNQMKKQFSHSSNPSNQFKSSEKSPQVESISQPPEKKLQFFQDNQINLQIQDQILDDQDSEQAKKQEDPFHLINDFIEEFFRQRILLDDFMEIAIQHSMLVLFGTTFPLSYLIAFLRSLLELQCDKLKLLNEMQRPIPISESTIGVWNRVLDGLAYLSLVVNSGQITAKRDDITSADALIQMSGFFLICLLANFFLRFVEMTLFSELPFQIQDLLQRQAYLIKNTVEKFRGSAERSSNKAINPRSLKRYPILKVYGTKVKDVKIKEIVELSSDSDVEDYVKRMEEVKGVKHEKKKVKPKVEKKAKSKNQQENEDVEENEEQEENQNLKLLQDASNKESSIEELQYYFNARISNWAMKFKMKDTQDKEQQLLQKIFFQKTLSYLKMKDQLNPHQKQWTLDRYTYRKFFLPRSLVLIRNLDWRRYLIFQEGDKRLKKSLKQQQNKKYEKQLDFLNKHQDIQQNVVEKMEILKKKKEFVKKHVWIDGRSTVFLRSGGVWFGQFRKSTSKVSGVKVAESYYRILEKYKKVCENENKAMEENIQDQQKEHAEDSNKTKKDTKFKPIDEQFFNLTCNLSQTQLKKFSSTSLISLLDSMQIRHKEHYIYMLSSKGVSQVEYQLDNYITNELRKQNRIMNFSYIPFRVQAPFLKLNQMQIWELFVEEQIRQTQPKINLLYRIDKKKDQFSSNIHTNIFGLQPQIKRWLMSYVDVPQRDDIMLYYTTDIAYNRNIFKDFINRVYRFYDIVEGPDYSSLNLPIGIAKLSYMKIQKQPQFFNVRDPLVKGYLCRAYNPPKNFKFCNGKTLKDVIKERKTKYTDNEISNFITSTIKLLDFLETNMGMFHGQLNLDSFILIERTDKSKSLQYVVLDFGMFFWYDLNTERTYFIRSIQQNDELWYMSPELLTNYLKPNNQLPINPQKCDIYSLGMVSLQMVTLGQMKLDAEKSLQEYDGDVGFTVRKWMMNNKNQLIHDYPNSSQLIMQLLHPDYKLRLYPSVMAAKFQGRSLFHENGLSNQNFDEELELLKQKRFCPTFYENILDELNGGQSTTQVFICIKSFLKQAIFSFEQYLILGQLEKFDEMSQDFEEILIQKYFLTSIEQSQEEMSDFYSHFQVYFKSNIVKLIQNNLDEFKYFIFYFQYKIMFFVYMNRLDFGMKQCTLLTNLLNDFEEIINEVVQLSQSEKNPVIQEKFKNDQNHILNLLQLQKEDYKSSKFMKSFSHHIRVYIFQMQILSSLICNLHSVYQIDIESTTKLVADQWNEIKYDLKYLEKDGNYFLLTNSIYIKLLNRLYIQFIQLQLQFDSFDNNALNTANELLIDIQLMQQFISNEKITEKQSVIKSIVKCSKHKQLNEDLMKSSLAYLNYYENQVKFILLLIYNRNKEFSQTEIIAYQLVRQIMQSNCALEQLNFIPMIGWIGEHYSETDQQENMQNVYRFIIQLMEEQFMIYESFQKESTIYFNHLKVAITQTIFYCSQLLYYNVLAMSNGIYQGFMQLIQSHNLYGNDNLLSHIIQIKLVHVLIENQQHQYPYYFRQNEDQLDYNYDVPNSVFSQSLISCLLKLYKFTEKYLIDNEEQETIEITWFQDEKISQLKLELLYGYTFILSKQNVESENHHHFTDLQMAIKKYILIIQEKLQNQNIFVIIENKVLYTRVLQLTYDYQEAFDHIKIVELLQQIQLKEEEISDQQTASLQQIFFSILDVHVNNHFFSNNQQSYKQMMLLDEMQFIKNHKVFYIRFLLIKLMDFYLKCQQLELNNELIKFLFTLYQNKAKMLKKEKYTLKLAMEISRLRTYVLSEELRQLVEKQDKKDNIKIQDLFEKIQTAYNVLVESKEKKQKKKKGKQPRLNTNSDINRYLLAQQLEQQDMDKIQTGFIHIDDKDQGFDNQIALCQLGVKLIVYQLHVGQFRDADSMAYNIKRKLFDLIYYEICRMALNWQSEKIFLKSNATEISVNQLFKALNIHNLNFENYEHNLLHNIEPIKQIALNVRNFLVLKQVLFMRLLYSYVEGLQALCIIMKGDFKLSKQNLNFVQTFGESNIDEISALITDVLMLFEITTADYTSASSKAIKLLKLLQKRIKQTNIQLQTHWIYSEFDDTRVQKQRIYHPIQVEQIISFEESDELQQFAETKFSYEETLTKTALRPYFEIAKLTTEAYFAYIESLIQQPKILIQSVDPIFYAQKYVQQQYGLQHIFNGHLQRLIATMYSEFLINKRVKDLEVALQQDSDKKIKFLKQEITAKTRVYLESRVKNKCTQQMEKKFQETKQFLKSKIKTLKTIRDGISYDVVCRWSLQAANESLAIYQKYCIEFKYESNPYLGSLYSTFANIFFVQNKIVSTQQYLEKVKNTLEYCYTSISNPDYCRYFYQLGYLRLHVFSIIKMYIEALIGLARLNPSEKFEVLLAIITENEKFLYHFDQYCSHGFFLFLEINILKQLAQERVIRDRLTQSYRKDEQDLIRYLQIEGDKLAFQKTIDANSKPYVHVVENVYKDAVHLIEKQTHKFNPDYTGLDLFIKAFQICKLLLTSDNTIYQKILTLVNKLSNRKNSLI
ncbi:unnamed protein product (macronuclear) [Paramecium tetraurelia]|uniref:Protein kinase domain-containing protein n=1 Tax=Paramecium tetraurelia TaxID=5888 RepID=A0BM92_PARTE|nr:uncharacterized protein GSPATT00030295001 [Paramecium tetraurelia]CAK59659.1 unnamed protein product [Paramecium tetraurelia]|eukprot:XP_001427057.1 hypothetical protein (macronuclear) [Paramecium tetraurelia strain d4-2]